MQRLLGFVRWVGNHANVTIALTLAVVCVLVGLATGFWLLFRFAYIVAFAVPLV